jgi:AraC-like DNA-binding protein
MMGKAAGYPQCVSLFNSRAMMPICASPPMTLRVKNMTSRATLAKGREATIAAGFARGLVDLANAKGADREELLRQASIDPATLADQDGRIPYLAYQALMRAGKALSGDSALALHFGEAFDMTELSIVGHICMACANGQEAFEQLARYSQLIVDVPVDDPQGRRLVIQREHGEVWLVDTRSNPDDFPELTESSFGRMAAAVHARRAGEQSVREIHVTHEPPVHRAEYARVFEVPVVFGSGRNALLMKDDSFLSAPLSPNPSRYVFGVFSARGDALLEELQAASTMRGRVESLLIPMLHTGRCDMETLAAKLAIGRRTLVRRLGAEGTTFERVLDELRKRMAFDYLAHRKLSVNETAYLVGFSDPSAFSRAFKRWTGKRPKEVRDS